MHIIHCFNFIVFNYATAMKPEENMDIVSGKKQAFYGDFRRRKKKEKNAYPCISKLPLQYSELSYN